MKRNMLKTMDKLGIDEHIRGLIRQMWKHCYKTEHCCQGGGEFHSVAGHGILAYVLFVKGTGDGWFEENAEKYGFKKCENHSCCKYKTDRKSKSGKKVCGKCGAGIYGYVIYEREPLEASFDKEFFRRE